MKKRIAVFTGTRAEYGLLYWLMKDIQDDCDLDLQILVSGMHLSPEYGNTYKQIENDGFVIDEKVEILLSSDTPVGIAKSMGLGIIGCSEALSRLSPYALVVLGDRYEALAAVQAALILRIPVVHLHGGEITEGAYDDAIRHAITKLSYMHCTSTEIYRRRVIQLGEDPARVVNVGAIGLDHLHRTPFMSLKDLSASLGWRIDKPYLVVTYHPVTWADELPKEAFGELLNSLDKFAEYQVIMTYPNADNGGREIIAMLESYANRQPDRVLAVPSLGQVMYLSAIKYAAVVVGNSSSGIIEVPAFGVLTVNIGARQKGRLAARSVIHCRPNCESITKAIKSATSENSNASEGVFTNPYGQGDASRQIVSILKMLRGNVVKTFYDLGME